MSLIRSDSNKSSIGNERMRKRALYRQRRQRESVDMGLSYPHPVPPSGSQTIEVAPRIHWLQLPMPMGLDHVNVYLFEDDDGWSVLDSGLKTEQSVDIWEGVVSHLFRQKPLRRVIVTHHHPDHIGMAGWLVENIGGMLIAPRTAWLIARMMQLDRMVPLRGEVKDYFCRTGLPKPHMERLNNGGFSGAFQWTHPVPLTCSHLPDAGDIVAAGRTWKIIYGHGHAPDQACLFCSQDNILLAADQLLPQISPVVGAWPLEICDDPLSSWIASCDRLLQVVNDETLILPGHNEPFYGGTKRLNVLKHHHESALDRLRQLSAVPFRVVDTFPILFLREVTPEVAGFATMEARAHINFLLRRGQLKRVTAPGGESDDVDWYQRQEQRTDLQAR